MYDQIREDTLFCMLYAAVTMLALTACCYLLFRCGNAFAHDVKSSLRLRRWTAALFASITLSHLWYMPILFLSSSDDMMLSFLIGTLLDCITFFPLAIIVMLTMLQDRRRPLWPVVVMVVPLVVIIALCIANSSDAPLTLLRVYLLLLGIGLIIYMVRATRQYGRWLRDNYADLEHKEVWQSLVVLAVILLVFGIYAVTNFDSVYQYILQLNTIVLICYLLWRVETLSDLSNQGDRSLDIPEQSSPTRCLSLGTGDHRPDPMIAEPEPLLSTDNIGQLLQRYCEDAQLYLQHDLTLVQLAKTIGTNRSYLSRYFSSQGLNYNVYINNLRINHFISLYLDSLATQCSVSAQQLAQQSGFRSYSTFSDAFKRKTGLSLTAWMKAADKQEQSQTG
jgi:AraC-like DNA-binding protein